MFGSIGQSASSAQASSFAGGRRIKWTWTGFLLCGGHPQPLSELPATVLYYLSGMPKKLLSHLSLGRSSLMQGSL